MRDIYRDLITENSVDLLQRQALRLGPIDPNCNGHHRGQDGEYDVVLPPDISKGFWRSTGEDDSGEEQPADADGRAPGAEIAGEYLRRVDVGCGVDAHAVEADVDEEEGDCGRLAGLVGCSFVEG